MVPTGAVDSNGTDQYRRQNRSVPIGTIYEPWGRLMPRLPQLTAETATPEQRDLLDTINRQLGRLPNLYASLVAGPAAIRGYLALRDALVASTLSAGVRERLALFIAQENGCGYCVAAHSFRAQAMGLTDDEVVRTRLADSADEHAAAVLQLARDVMRTAGRVSDDALARARAASVTDAELAEIVAHIALNTLSNYFNHLAEPELDFPEVDIALPSSR
jgi:uncharacterized peroxidase-related enzyme